MTAGLRCVDARAGSFPVEHGRGKFGASPTLTRNCERREHRSTT
jgi:hypothetical protein